MTVTCLVCRAEVHVSSGTTVRRTTRPGKILVYCKRCFCSLPPNRKKALL